MLLGEVIHTHLVTRKTKEIKSAYLAQAKKLHPDANQTDPNAQQHFQKLQEAYNVLKDTQAKWEYDRTLDPPRNTTAR